MKAKNVFLLICLLLLGVSTFAQWTQQTTGTNKNLHKLYCISADTVIAVGDSGTIIKTVNGGTTWYQIPSVTTQNINSVFFADKNTGVAVGDSGTVLRTTDCGETWNDTIIYTPSYFGPIRCKLTDLCFTTMNTGFVIGNTGSYFKTNNSGINWIIDSIQIPFYEMKQIYFISPDTGFVLAYDLPGLMLPSTVDGGITWGGSYGSPGWYYGDQWDGRSICHIHEPYITLGNTKILVAGYGPAAIIAGPSGNQPYDGGLSETGNYFYSITSVNKFTGIAGLPNIVIGVGTNGLLAYMAEPAFWHIVNLGITQNLNHVAFANSDIGYIAGDNGLIFKTTVGGYVGINQPEQPATQISIIYNSASKNIEVSNLPVDKMYIVSVYDIAGKELVNQVNYGDNAVVNAAKMPAGIYFVNIICGEKIEKKKIVIN